jgi:hypothetical protein
MIIHQNHVDGFRHFQTEVCGAAERTLNLGTRLLSRVDIIFCPGGRFWNQSDVLYTHSKAYGICTRSDLSRRHHQHTFLKN